ncbi:pectate lyase [Cyclobacterium plantarum]|uniref:pectate lyase n=1 Tax=Cyclobacterium plantarum TaxID=2716263 RepID=UPI003F71A47E
MNSLPKNNLYIKISLLLLFMVQAMSTFAQNIEKVPWKRINEQPDTWYESEEAIRIAENMLLHQKDIGGWYKNIDMSVQLSEEEKSRLRKDKSSNMGATLDNDAGFIQIAFLSKTYRETKDPRFSQAVFKALDYMMDAQYENGGWPQYYPIREGYYEHITFNDGAMIQVMQLLRNVADGKKTYDFVDADRKQRAQKAIEKGLEIILRTQIKVDGTLTAWCAQYDKDDLSPAKARAYELPSISGSESVGIVRYLMAIENPEPKVVQAIESAIAWFEVVKLEGIKLVQKEDETLPRGYDRIVVKDETAGPLWARFYEIGTNRPMFVGRDSVVRYALHEIEHERRVGYSFLGPYAKELLESDYPEWKRRMGD